MTLKNILSISAAALALVACSSDDALLEQKAVADEAGQAINFGTYTSQTGTRATITTNQDLQYATKGFKVWANVKRTGTSTVEALFSEQSVTYNKTDKCYEYAPVKYWPTSADATVDYYALYNEPLTCNYDLTTDWNNLPQMTFYVNPTVKDQSDFIWAKPLLDQKRTDYTAADSKLNFEFKHALVGHYFTFRTAADYSATIKKIVINSITIEGYYAPKAIYNPTATDINDIWTLQGDWEKRSYTISTENGGIDTPEDTENWADGKAHTVLAAKGNSKNQHSDAQISGTDAPKCDYIMVLPFNHNNVANPGKQNVTVTVNYTIYTLDSDGTTLIPQTNEASVDDTFDYSTPGTMICGGIVLTLNEIKFNATIEDWDKATSNTVPIP